jgi:hypothetical protein
MQLSMPSSGLLTLIESLKQLATRMRKLSADSDDPKVQSHYAELASGLDDMRERAEADARRLGVVSDSMPPPTVRWI